MDGDTTCYDMNYWETCYRCGTGTGENDDWRYRQLIKRRVIICGECDDLWDEDDDEWDAECAADEDAENDTDDEKDDDEL
jgi:uncharacterized CHY-type Zn-finger protein